MSNNVNSENLFERPLILPCGAVIKNRIVKSAMSDSLGDGEGNATDAQSRLYEVWAEGGVGLSIIGEVQVDPFFPEKPGNLVLTKSTDLPALRDLTSRSAINGAHIWPQLSHAGGLSHSPINRPKGPSPLSIGSFECEGMSGIEVAQLPGQYAKAAEKAKLAGFTGVQIHAGHGFLLSQFLSPLCNLRNDQYGGSIVGRCQVIIDIIAKVRSVVGRSFPIGIKINSSDQLEGGLTEEDALQVIAILDNTSIDLIEISGGSYFPGAKSSSDRVSKGPYFVKFAEKSKKITTKPIIVTGGFKTREQALNSLEVGATDFVGIARALVLNPNLTNNWISGIACKPEFPRFKVTPEGGVTAWFTMLLTAIGNNNSDNFNLDILSAIELYEKRDDARCIKWKRKFFNR